MALSRHNEAADTTARMEPDPVRHEELVSRTSTVSRWSLGFVGGRRLLIPASRVRLIPWYQQQVYWLSKRLAIGSRMLMHVSEPYLMLPLFFSKLHEASRVVQKTCGDLLDFRNTTPQVWRNHTVFDQMNTSFDGRLSRIESNNRRSAAWTWNWTFRFPRHHRQGCLLCWCYTLNACLFVQEAHSGRAVTGHACIRGSDVNEGSFQAGRQIVLIPLSGFLLKTISNLGDITLVWSSSCILNFLTVAFCSHP
jgi:hypothetical protein